MIIFSIIINIIMSELEAEHKKITIDNTPLSIQNNIYYIIHNFLLIIRIGQDGHGSFENCIKYMDDDELMSEIKIFIDKKLYPVYIYSKNTLKDNDYNNYGDDYYLNSLNKIDKEYINMFVSFLRKIDTNYVPNILDVIENNQFNTLLDACKSYINDKTNNNDIMSFNSYCVLKQYIYGFCIRKLANVPFGIDNKEIINMIKSFIKKNYIHDIHNYHYIYYFIHLLIT